MFRNMEYVYKIYLEKSFSKAAEKLYISQPSLSATVKKLENRIGSPIFDRSTNPIQLTECGMEYVRCIEQVMDIENSFQNYLNNLNELMAGNLVVGGASFFSAYILPPIISLFKKRHPKVNVNLVEADTPHLEKLLYNGDVDMVLDNYILNEDIYTKQPFSTDHLVLASSRKSGFNNAARDYQLTIGDLEEGKHKNPSVPSVPLDLIRDAPFICLRSGNDTRNRSDAIFAEAGITPGIAFELDQLVTAYHIACNGMGLTLVSDTIAKKVRHYPDAVFYKVGSSYVTRENYIYYRKNRYITRPMEVFTKIARRVGRGMHIK